MKRKTIGVPKDAVRAEIRADSVDKENRTFDVIYSTGSRVKRRGRLPRTAENPDRDEFGEFYVELEISKKAIDQERLSLGAPFLNNHGFELGPNETWLSKMFLPHQNKDVIGRTFNPRIENKNAVVSIRMSSRTSDGVQDLFNDIADDVRPNVSVGFIHLRFIQLKKNADDGLPVFRSVHWRPIEVSSVPIGADPGAQIRAFIEAHEKNHDSLIEFFDCEIITTHLGEPPEMKNDNKTDNASTTQNAELAADPAIVTHSASSDDTDLEPPKPEPASNVRAIDDASDSATKAERERSLGIRSTQKQLKLSDDHADRAIAGGLSLADYRALAIDESTKDQRANPTHGIRIEAGDYDEQSVFDDGIQNAMLHRSNAKKHELDGKGQMYRFFTMKEMAARFLEINGIDTRGMSPREIAKRALSTSDFPELLANVAGKTLRDGYAEAKQTFERFTRRVSLPDFKQVSRTLLGDAPELEQVLEDGEIVRGSLGENAEKYSLLTFAKSIPFTRRTIINDDQDAFTRVPFLLGRRAASKEADLAYDVLINNTVMQDGNALVSAAHGNLNTGGAAALDVIPLGLMRAAMKSKKGLGEDNLETGDFITVEGHDLYVPTKLQTKAEQIIFPLQPRQVSEVNPQARWIENVICEPRLDAISDTVYFLMSTTDEIDMIELGNLDGSAGPILEINRPNEIDGVEYTIILDAVAHPIEYRGFNRNDGA